jgi:mannose/fructose/N-acetylgalactosamine-specific phosphotransferase system component IIC
MNNPLMDLGILIILFIIIVIPLWIALTVLIATYYENNLNKDAPEWIETSLATATIILTAVSFIILLTGLIAIITGIR